MWYWNKWKLCFVLFCVKPFGTRLKTLQHSKVLISISSFNNFTVSPEMCLMSLTCSSFCCSAQLKQYKHICKLRYWWHFFNLTWINPFLRISTCVWKFWIVLQRLMARDSRLSLLCYVVCNVWCYKFFLYFYTIAVLCPNEQFFRDQLSILMLRFLCVWWACCLWATIAK